MLLLTSAVYADFSIATENAEKTICIGSTATLVDKVSGASGQYTVETSGDAVAFTTTVPTEFELKDSQNIYSYVTVSSKIKAGVYDLTVKIKSGDVVKEQTHKITAKDCHGTSLSVDGDKKACPCDKVKYKLALENQGEFKEKFKITAEGTAKEWTNLSLTSVELASGESKEFYAYVEPPCNVNGDYTLTFKAVAEASLAGASTTANLEILPCYEYDIGIEKEYNICENEKINIPIKINNKGTAGNTFAIVLDGPGWAKLSAKSIDIDSETEKSVDINVQPPFKTDGNFTLKIETMTSAGNVKKTAETSVNARRCYGVDLDVANEDKLCKKEKEYSIMIKNLGEFDSTYSLKIEGPDWAKLEDSSIKVDAKKNATIKLEVKPENAEFKKYNITITATDDASKESDSGTLVLEVSSPEDCYKAEITSEENRINVELEKSKTLFLMLKNNGLDEAEYTIELDGKGAKFAIINPNEIKLSPGETETLYLYISPPLFTDSGEYNLTVTAKEKDSKIETKKDIIIGIMGEGEQKTAENETIAPETAAKENIIIRAINAVKNFFKKLFMVQPPVEETQIATNVSVAVNSSITTAAVEEINETAEAEEIVNITANAAAEENESLEIAPAENLSNAEENTAEINATNETAEEAVVNVTAEENETAEIAIENKTETAPVKEIEGFNARAEKVITQYKSYIIGAVILLILIIILSSGLGKSIIEFFEEEE